MACNFLSDTTGEAGEKEDEGSDDEDDEDDECKYNLNTMILECGRDMLSRPSSSTRFTISISTFHIAAYLTSRTYFTSLHSILDPALIQQQCMPDDSSNPTYYIDPSPTFYCVRQPTGAGVGIITVMVIVRHTRTGKTT